MQTQVQDQQTTEIALQLSVLQFKDKEFLEFMHRHLGRYEELEERMNSLYSFVSKITAHTQLLALSMQSCSPQVEETSEHHYPFKVSRNYAAGSNITSSSADIWICKQLNTSWRTKLALKKQPLKVQI